MIKAEYIDHMGSDTTVVNAARVSFNKQVKEMGDDDKRLIKYLAKHNHWTPFSHPQIMMRESVPIFVARQRFKHMVGFTYNEISRRYVDDTPEFYMPDTWRSRPDGSVKQGSGDTHPEDDYIRKWWADAIKDTALAYTKLIDGGVAPEQARMVLPQNTMTSYYVTGSLAAWARMVKQRKDPHAQKEIQELAKCVEAVIAPRYPVSWEALMA